MKPQIHSYSTNSNAIWERAADGEFRVGGRPLSGVVDAVGSTPCYLYDRQRLSARVAALRAALPEGIQLHYAVKANPMPALVCHMANLVDGLDVASRGELRTALDSGMPADRISFAGPGKSDAELRQSHAAGILVNIESFRELDALKQASERSGIAARVAVRVNLPFELRASGMKMSGGSRPFGVDAERVPELLADIAAAGLDFEGFHLFAGSQNLNAQAIVEAQTRSYELVLDWLEVCPVVPRILNLGGGFGIPYTLRDSALELASIADNLEQLCVRSRREMPGVSLAIELGRYLVGEAGLYVVRVIDRKISRGQVYLVVDGGMHHHLAASGNFGQVMRRNYPVAVNRLTAEKETASVVGPLCTPLDLLADNAELDRAEVGDLVVVFQSGAYGRSASPREFLSHPDAVEALV
ncbi:pyridoxal-dependent decarboxylase, exosortase A system-associated [Dokdonella sp.]|uniref:pyridoxal-dependent decarboxylase, exosortase A system-associated n=1 Tax=Dokdonella sp. TaxID=2291710 RepID=UPI003C3747D0